MKNKQLATALLTAGIFSSQANGADEFNSGDYLTRD